MLIRVVLLAGVAIALGAPVSQAKDKKPEPNTAQATLLDFNSYPCENCLFGNSDYYFCFDANQKILVGHEKVRTQTWQKTPVGLSERGKSVSLRYDDKYIWVAAPGGKEQKLTQDYTKKIFLENQRCQATTK
jgi:hypothetical protein